MKDKHFAAKGIIFDLDGTIVDSRGAYSAAVRTAMESTCRKKTIISPSMALEIPRRLEQGLPITDIIKETDEKRFLDCYLHTFHRSTATKSKPFDGILDTLDLVSSKFKLGLVTMRCVSNRSIREELNKLELSKYFSCIMTALDTKRPKPCPDSIIESSERMEIMGKTCLVVGDSVIDVRAGKAAGFETAAVLSGIYSRRELELEEPDLILKSVLELPRFLP